MSSIDISYQNISLYAIREFKSITLQIESILQQIGLFISKSQFYGRVSKQHLLKARGATETVISSLSNTLAKKMENIPDLLKYSETDWNISTFIAYKNIFTYTRPGFDIKST